MPKKKQMSITATREINFAPMSKDIEPLGYFERVLMKRNHCESCNEVSNAEILRYIIHEYYDYHKRKRR